MLTTRNKEFIRRYFERHLDKARGAAEAWFEIYGVKGHAAVSNASRVLTSDDGKAFLQRLYDRREELTNREMQEQWRKTRAIREQIATVDPAMMYNEDGSLKKVRDMPFAVRKAIKKIKTRQVVDEDGQVVTTSEYELHPIQPHLDALEDKFSILPDTRKPPVRVDVTSGGQAIGSTPDERRTALLMLIQALKEQAALAQSQQQGYIAIPESLQTKEPEVRVIPQSNGKNGSH